MSSVDPVDACEAIIKRIAAEAEPRSERQITNEILEGLAAARLLWLDDALAPDGRFSAALSTAARITYLIAGHSGSAGLVYAMHISQVFTLERHARNTPFLAALLQTFRDNQALIASGTSEKGVGGDIFGTLCTVERSSDDGFVVRKDSPNISYLDLARAVLITAMSEHSSGGKTQVLIIALREDMRIASGEPTEFLGMKGVDNRPYQLEANFGRKAILEDDFPTIARSTMTPVIHILWAALWAGLAHTAINRGRKVFLSSSGTPDTVKAVLTSHISLFTDKLFTINATIRDIIQEFDAPHDTPLASMNWAANVKRLKTLSSTLATEICLGMFDVAGMPAYAEDGPHSLASIIRDVLSSKAMISNCRLLDSNAAVERYLQQSI